MCLLILGICQAIQILVDLIFFFNFDHCIFLHHFWAERHDRWRLHPKRCLYLDSKPVLLLGSQAYIVRNLMLSCQFLLSPHMSDVLVASGLGHCETPRILQVNMILTLVSFSAILISVLLFSRKFVFKWSIKLKVEVFFVGFERELWGANYYLLALRIFLEWTVYFQIIEKSLQ